MNGSDSRGLRREQRQQPLRLGLEHLPQHLVPLQRLVREHEAFAEQLGEVGRVADAVAELGEEAADLPRDGLSQQLVAAAREVPVDVARLTPDALTTSSTVVLPIPKRATHV